MYDISGRHRSDDTDDFPALRRVSAPLHAGDPFDALCAEAQRMGPIRLEHHHFNLEYRRVPRPRRLPSRRARRRFVKMVRPGYGPQRIEAYFRHHRRNRRSYPVAAIRWVLQEHERRSAQRADKRGKRGAKRP